MNNKKITKKNLAFLSNIINEEHKNYEEEEFNKEILYYNISLVKEAVKHFNSSKFVPTKTDPYDERYFFKREDLDAFLSLCENPLVKWKVIVDDCGEFFAYEIFRIKGKSGTIYKTKKNKEVFFKEDK